MMETEDKASSQDFIIGCFVWGGTFFIHIGLGVLILLTSRPLLQNDSLEFVSIVLVSDERPGENITPEPTTSAISSEMANHYDGTLPAGALAEPSRKPIQNPNVSKNDFQSPPAEITANDPNDSSPSIVSLDPSENTDTVTRTPHIPSRWALKPPLATSRLERLGISANDINCLQSLEEDCQQMRKEIFAEYQLTETDLIWTPLRADTGLPSQFYGLTDREIRARLNIPTAGENGVFIPFTDIGISGPIVDKMHGVNKTCKLVPSIAPVDSSQSGTLGVRRVCD